MLDLPNTTGLKQLEQNKGGCHMTPKQAIKFIKDHGFATAQSRVEFQLAIDILEEYVESQEITDEERVKKVKEHESGVKNDTSRKV